jgi:hypothetical protein
METVPKFQKFYLPPPAYVSIRQHTSQCRHGHGNAKHAGKTKSSELTSTTQHCFETCFEAAAAAAAAAAYIKLF